mmetsp:Transcript_1677/g.4981  ORF Transcript_1677/g.4981 Transcript_1677/m.4981 type:complete len:109 (-) Transcript_1677:1399-1725(-)
MCPAFLTVDSLWAIRSTVHPARCSDRPRISCRSVSTSRALVASSMMRILGRFSRARAMATRCFWPPERLLPKPPTSVSRPRGSCAAKPDTPATAAAASTSVSEAPCRP